MKYHRDGKIEYLKNALRYLKYNKDGEIREDLRYIGGKYVRDPWDVNKSFYNMMTIKRFFNKTGNNPLLHLIIALDYKYGNDIKNVIEYGDLLCDYFDKFQTVYCIHEKEHEGGKYHIHLIINASSYVDGKIMNVHYTLFTEFERYVMNVIGLNKYEIKTVNMIYNENH